LASVAVVRCLGGSFGRLALVRIVLACPAGGYLTCLGPRCHILEPVGAVPAHDSDRAASCFDLYWMHKMTDTGVAVAMGMAANRSVVLVKAVVDIGVETAATVLGMHHN